MPLMAFLRATTLGESIVPDNPVRIIVAHDEARVIGHRGQIPWDLPADRRFFAEQTAGGTLVMGWKTYRGLCIDRHDRHPLPGRQLVVLCRPSRTPRWALASSILDAYLFGCLEAFGRPIWIVGGAQVYAAALAAGVVDEVVASLVPGQHEGDARFPVLDPAEWREVSREPRDGFEVVRYVRVDVPADLA